MAASFFPQRTRDTMAPIVSGRRGEKSARRAERFFRVITRTHVIHRRLCMRRLCLVIRQALANYKRAQMRTFTDGPLGSAGKEWSLLRLVKNFRGSFGPPQTPIGP